MIAKTNCQHCGNEFEIDGMSRTEFCPQCGKETVVVAQVQSPKPAPTRAPSQSTASLIPCDCCGHPISREAWFCFECGKFHASLFSIVWRVVCCAGVAAAILSLIGLVIGKIIELANK